MRRVKTFLRLERAEQLAFMHGWLALVAAKVGLNMFGVRRMLQLLPDNPAPGQSLDSLPRAARWLHVAARYCPGGAKCLPRSIAMLALLRQAGIACELRVGVGQTTPALEAHAWVEVNGVPVNDTGDIGQRYSAFEPATALS
jgi:hypothetical protein